jgi:uncharacterized protein YecE (DUF72 family)
MQGYVYVCVDEPQGLRSSVPPDRGRNGDVAEVRFHGRNRELWEARDVSPARPHEYDYQIEELAEWIPKIMLLHGATGRSTCC